MLRVLLATLVLGALAGCVSSPDLQAASATADATTGAAVANLTQAIALEGFTPAYFEACAWSPVAGECLGGPPTSDFSKLRLAPEIDGTPTAFAVTITWAAASPANEEMTAFASAVGDKSVKTLGWKVGKSPLTLTVDDLQLDGARLEIGLAGPVAGQGTPAGGVSGSASPMDQPWKLEGVVTVAAPEATASS